MCLEVFAMCKCKLLTLHKSLELVNKEVMKTHLWNIWCLHQYIRKMSASLCINTNMNFQTGSYQGWAHSVFHCSQVYMYSYTHSVSSCNWGYWHHMDSKHIRQRLSAIEKLKSKRDKGGFYLLPDPLDLILSNSEIRDLKMASHEHSKMMKRSSYKHSFPFRAIQFNFSDLAANMPNEQRSCSSWSGGNERMCPSSFFASRQEIPPSPQ